MSVITEKNKLSGQELLINELKQRQLNKIQRPLNEIVNTFLKVLQDECSKSPSKIDGDFNFKQVESPRNITSNRKCSIISSSLTKSHFQEMENKLLQEKEKSPFQDFENRLKNQIELKSLDNVGDLSPLIKKAIKNLENSKLAILNKELPNISIPSDFKHTKNLNDVFTQAVNELFQLKQITVKDIISIDGEGKASFISKEHSQWILKSFKEFMDNEFCTENLNFVLKVDHFKQERKNESPNIKTLRSIILDLRTKHLTKGGLEEINFTDDLRDKILAKPYDKNSDLLKNWPEDSYKAIENEIIFSLEEKVKNFRENKSYKAFVDEIFV